MQTQESEGKICNYKEYYLLFRYVPQLGGARMQTERFTLN
jgi:hypothetical protein